LVDALAGFAVRDVELNGDVTITRLHFLVPSLDPEVRHTLQEPFWEA
jgi:hypothetical protein